MSALREIRLTRFQLAGVATLSAIATALVIANALGSTGAQIAAMQALRQRRVIVERQPSQPVVAAAAPASPSDHPVLNSAPSFTPSSPSSNGQASAPTSSSGGGAPGTYANPSDPKTTQAPRHKVGHAFVIALSTTSFNAAFGPGSVAHYLSRTLRRKGTLLAGYRTLGRSELPDYLAMISGQAPNPDTEGECSTYADFPAGTAPDAGGLVHGLGCVYPNTVLTVGDQVTASGHLWRAYVQDMASSTCVHPNSGAVDDAPLPGAGTDYATRHNPFIYFHSLLDLGGCASDDVSLAQLPTDLRSASTTPTYSFIAPGACLDAAATSCPDGGPPGLPGEDAFLKHWVPRILRSPAYRRDGILIIVFSSAQAQSLQSADAPVRTGALVLSPYARSSKRVSTTYDPYSLLRSVEDFLGYTPLARAKSASSFATKVLPGVA